MDKQMSLSVHISLSPLKGNSLMLFSISAYHMGGEVAFCGWNPDPNILQIDGETFKKITQFAFHEENDKGRVSAWPVQIPLFSGP